MERASGVLLHISSLPGKYGIGQLGKSAYDFIDFLSKAGQKYWQVLPTVPTGYGDSPYQSCYSLAGNEYFIDIDLLIDSGLLTSEEAQPFVTELNSRINYEQLFLTRYDLLKLAFARFDRSDKKFLKFVNSGEYYEYSLYRALKFKFNHLPWSEWEDCYKNRDSKALKQFASDNSDDLIFWQWLQFIYREQWTRLKKYAIKKGISIIGDIPIYVAYDSVECWSEPNLFAMDADSKPTVVAGCPPDYFSEDGQLWGNPLYIWEEMKKDNYKWWVNRLKKSFKLYHMLRIDHFRGFDRYYAIEFGRDNARVGQWLDAPSTEFFRCIESQLGQMNVIAEDLGSLDESALKMFSEVGYPGMKILQFAFDNESNGYLPHNYTSDNYVVYPGTHDNDTIMGFISSMDWEGRNHLREQVLNECERLELSVDIENDYALCDAIISLSYNSRASISICQLQDYLYISSEGRINLPSTLSTDNWSYRVPFDYGSDELASKIYALTLASKRI